MCIIALIYKVKNVQHNVVLKKHDYFSSLNFEQRTPVYSRAAHDKNIS